MRHIDLCSFPPDSACAALALSCRSAPDFLITADRGSGLSAARWRFRHASLPTARRLSDNLLWYCASGCIDAALVVDGVASRTQIRQGSMGILLAATETQWTLASDSESTLINIYVPRLGSRATEASPTAQPSRQPAFEFYSAWLRSYFRLLIAEYEQCMSGSGVEDSSFLDETSGLLMRHLDSLLRWSSPTPARQAPGVQVAPLRPFILRRVEAFVDSHLESTVKLDNLAALAAMSVGHFVRSFRRATGLTPHQYILERRLDKACLLLREGTDRVSVVARRCGFGNPAHFSAMFHARRGCSPSDFRRDVLCGTDGPKASSESRAYR